MDLVLVKKLVSYLLYPYTLTLVMLTAGVWLLASGRRGRAGRALAVGGLALLVLQSLPLVPNFISGEMQSAYKPIVSRADIPPGVKWVVVLSGASNDDPGVPVSSRNVGDTLHRVVEGVVLASRIPDAKLLLSGGSVYGEGPASKAMADMARELGVLEERIVTEDKSRDTEDQARIIAGMAGKEKMILVTSARHMARSMALFRAYGMEPVPAPAALPMKGESFNPMSLLPNPRAAMVTGSVTHELMGLAWAWVKGVGR